MSGGDVLAWIAMGAAAALAGMVWPFRRGAIGIVVNFVAGTAGALVFGFVSGLTFPSLGPLRLFFAALGAIVALLAAHAAWNRYVRDRRRSVA